MYNEWSLDVLYQGLDAPNLSKDIAALEAAIAEYKTAVDALSLDDLPASLRKAVDCGERMGLLARRLFSFFSLRRSANSADKEGAAYLVRLQMMMTANAKESVRFQKFVGSIEDLESMIAKDEVLSEYRFYFSEIKAAISHTMSDECEELFARMNLSGGKAWSDLFSHLTAGVEVDYTL